MLKAFKRVVSKPSKMTYEKQTLINQVYKLDYDTKENLISVLGIYDAFSRIIIKPSTKVNLGGGKSFNTVPEYAQWCSMDNIDSQGDYYSRDSINKLSAKALVEYCEANNMISGLIKALHYY